MSKRGNRKRNRDLPHRAPLASPLPRSQPARNGPVSGGSPADVGPPVNVAFVLHSLRRWWKVALPVGLAGAAIAAAVVLVVFEPAYRATAWVRIEDRTPYIAFPSHYDTARFVRTQIEILRSPLVLGLVTKDADVSRLQVMQDQAAPEEWLKSRLSVNSVQHSEFLRVSFDGPKPSTSAAIVNAVLQAYLKVQENESVLRNQRIIALLEQERERRSAELERLRGNIRELHRLAAGNEPALYEDQDLLVQQSPVQRTLIALQDQLTSTEVNRELLEAKLMADEEFLASEEVEIAPATVERVLGEHPQLINLQEGVLQLKAKLDAVQRASAEGVENAVIRRLKHDIEEAEKKIALARDELRPTVKEALEESALKQRQETLAKMGAEIAGFQRLEGVLDERIKQQRKQLAGVSDQSLDLEYARSDLAREQEVFRRITDRIEQLKTESNAPTRVHIFQQAEAPTSPVESVPYTRLGAACLASFCLPFGLAVLWELKVRRIGEPQQIKHEANLPVVGEITRLPVRAVRSGSRVRRRFERHRSTFEESVDYVRTSLLLSENLKDLKVMVVASAMSREGKTSLASHLAVSLARSGLEPTLLIDADLRHPNVHELFEIDLEPGLADVLARQSGTDEAIVASGTENLHLLPAGQLTQNPHVLLGNGAFEAIVERVRSNYRYVVVDAPPVLPVSDALIIARAGDGTIISTMRDVSRGPQVKLACERLTSAGASLLGAVLNGVPPGSYTYRYRSSSYDYSSWQDSTNGTNSDDDNALPNEPQGTQGDAEQEDLK